MYTDECADIKVSDRHVARDIHHLDILIKRMIERSEKDTPIYNLTGTNGWMIRYLYANRHKDVFQKDIEEHFNIRRSTVSKMVDGMEKKGLIERSSVEGDARRKRLTLTPFALEINALICENLERTDRELKANISHDDLKVFFSVLDKIKQNIDSSEMT